MSDQKQLLVFKTKHISISRPFANWLDVGFDGVELHGANGAFSNSFP